MNVRDYVLKWIRRDPNRYLSLHAEMISARVGMTLDQYLWRSIKIALLIGILLAILGYFAGTIITLALTSGKIGIYNVFDIQIPPFIISIYPRIILEALALVIVFILGAYLGYTLLLRLPSIEKKSRSIKINLTLHNAVAYMYAMRRGGTQLMPIFQSLSTCANIYGEVSLEFRQIVRDADFFGYDVISAIRHLAETTPSEKLKNFLEDLLSVIESGGDMAEFLSLRVRLYQEEAKFEQKQFLNILSLVAESYVTLFVAGPLFLIIIMVVMGLMGGSAVLQLSFLIYAVMPIGSAIFILLVDIISIKAETTERFVRAKWLHTYSNVKIIKQGSEAPLFAQLKKYDQHRFIIQHLKHPIESLSNNVNHTLYITVPVAILYTVFTFMKVPRYGSTELYISVVDDHIIIAILIVLIPYAIFYMLWSRKVLGIQALIPDFLERMSGINQVGLTLAQAIAIMANTNLGLLRYEIRKIKKDMEWGANFTEALVRFEERVSTPAIARTVTLITKASEMSGQIGEVLSIASMDAKMSEVLKKERLSEMFIYTAIIYLSFFVFLFIVGVLTVQFLPILANITSSGLTSTAGMGGALGGVGTVPVVSFNRLFYHACLIQALFSGLIAGQMGESSIAGGVKHSCVLLIITLIVFNFVLIV